MRCNGELYRVFFEMVGVLATDHRALELRLHFRYGRTVRKLGATGIEQRLPPEALVPPCGVAAGEAGGLDRPPRGDGGAIWRSQKVGPGP